MLARCSAEIPVVRPWRVSTETVKAVPSGASFIATIGCRFNRCASSAVKRRADDAAAFADDERHFFGRAHRGGEDQVAFVLAVVVVGDDDDFAAGEGFDRLGDRMCDISFPCSATARAPRKSLGVTAPRVSATMCSAVSRETQAPSSLQICVIAPGDTPMRRAKSERLTPLRVSQSRASWGEYRRGDV